MKWDMARRGAKGGGTIRQRPDGTWEGRFTVGRDPGTGKQIQRSAYGKTQKEVRIKLSQAVAELDQGSYFEPEKMTVGKWLDIWVKDYLGDIKPNTARSYKSQISNHIKPALGAVKLEALNAHTIQVFYNSICKGEKADKGISPSTLKITHGVLHKALKQAVQNGYIRFNPAESCKLPRVEKKEIKPLDEDDMVAFLNAIKGHQYEVLFTLDLFTGMRQGEILGLKWECVDFENGTILIDKQLQWRNAKNGGYELCSLKNEKVRVITPAPWVMKQLKTHRGRQTEAKLRAGELWQESGYVFTDELGGHLYHISVYKNYKRLASKIGISASRFHDLRHSYAVASIRSGDDIKTVQGNLGHATAAFTLDVYGHVTDQMKRASAERMDRFIIEVLKL
jgi:integrase